MSKRILSLALTALLVCALGFSSPMHAQVRTEERTPTAAQVEAVVARLRDNLRVEENSGRDSFTTNTRPETAARFAFPQTQTARRNNLSSSAKVGIGLGIAATVAVIIAVAISRNNDRQNFSSGPIICVTSPCP